MAGARVPPCGVMVALVRRHASKRAIRGYSQRRMPRSMIPVHQKPAGVVKFDTAVEKVKTKAFWGLWAVIAGGSILSLASYFAAGPQALLDSAFSKVKVDPVVARKLGSPLKAYGQGCECRKGGSRKKIPVEEYRHYARTTFFIEGPRGKAVVDARVKNRGITNSVFRRVYIYVYVYIYIYIYIIYI
ncbi:hypothetical protein AAMO2058_001577900 [Amorphochlora amoebiformis]